MKNQFNRTFWTDLCYVLVPLLPVGFTFFWKMSTLHGTVCFLKMEKRIKKFISTSNSRNDSKLNEALFHHYHHQNEKKLHFPSSDHPQNIPLLNTAAAAAAAAASSNRRRLSSTLKKNDEDVMMSGITINSNVKLRNASLSSNEEAELASIIASMEEFKHQDEDDECMIGGGGVGGGGGGGGGNFVDLEAAVWMQSRPRRFFSIRRIVKPLMFYFKISKMIIFNSCIDESRNDDLSSDDNLKNASFIYYSNFLIGLGIITVSFFLVIWG